MLLLSSAWGAASHMIALAAQRAGADNVTASGTSNAMQTTPVCACLYQAGSVGQEARCHSAG